MTEGTWIRFVDGPPRPKTKTWKVMMSKGGALLGTIDWYGPWRKYQYTPAPGTGYEQTCLREIAVFVQEQTRRHYERLREQRDGQLTLGIQS